MDTAKTVRTSIVVATLITGIAVCGPAWGQSDDSAGQRESVLQRVERLERELEELKALLTQMSQERVEQTAKDRPSHSHDAGGRGSSTPTH